MKLSKVHIVAHTYLSIGCPSYRPMDSPSDSAYRAHPSTVAELWGRPDGTVLSTWSPWARWNLGRPETDSDGAHLNVIQVGPLEQHSLVEHLQVGYVRI